MKSNLKKRYRHWIPRCAPFVHRSPLERNHNLVIIAFKYWTTRRYIISRKCDNRTKYLYPIKAKHCSVVREMLDIVDTDWHECVTIDRHLHLMMAKASLSHFCTHALLGFNTFAGTFYFAGDNFVALVESANITSRPFPIKIQLPFDAEQSPIYELLVVVLFMHSLAIVYLVNILSSLIFTLVRFAKFVDKTPDNFKVSCLRAGKIM